MHFMIIVYVTLAHKRHLAIVDNIKSQFFGRLPINNFLGISIPLWNTIHLSIPSFSDFANNSNNNSSRSLVSS